jgi:hypothetical protein
MKTKTQNDGAAQERAAIKRKVQRLLNQWRRGVSANGALSELIDWIDTRTVRTAKRKGGLGRK